jgi:hypothetical protein
MCVAQGVSPGKKDISPFSSFPPIRAEEAARIGGRMISVGFLCPRAHALRYTHAAPPGLSTKYSKVVM